METIIDSIRSQLQALAAERGLTYVESGGRGVPCVYRVRLQEGSGWITKADVYGKGATEDAALREAYRRAQLHGWLRSHAARLPAS